MKSVFSFGEISTAADPAVRLKDAWLVFPRTPAPPELGLPPEGLLPEVVLILVITSVPPISLTVKLIL